MGMLFDCSTDNIGLHLKNIFASGELVKDSVTEKISATASDGKKYMTQFYNLDAVITMTSGTGLPYSNSFSQLFLPMVNGAIGTL